MVRSILVASALAAALAGCSNPVDSAFDKLTETIKTTCENCAADRGVTVDECRSVFDPILATDAERDCLKAVADRHESANTYYDCADERAGQYQSCMESAGCNAAETELCGNIISSIDDTCPLPSEVVAAEIDACVS